MKNSIFYEIIILGDNKRIFTTNKSKAYYNIYVPFCKDHNLQPYGKTKFSTDIKIKSFLHHQFLIRKIPFNQFIFY